MESISSAITLGQERPVITLGFMGKNSQRTWPQGKNQEHNPEALRLLLHNVTKRQPDQYPYMSQDDRT